MADSTYRLRVSVPKSVSVDGQTFEREDFYGWLWERFQDDGLLGVHEGTLLSEEAHQQGFETESFTVDAAEAPRERDWIASQVSTEVELYFGTLGHAEAAARFLAGLSGVRIARSAEEVVAQDWDAEWKASFQGIRVPPYWAVLPPWVEANAETVKAGEKLLRLNPGAGFGTGTHETTQLCLGFVGRLAASRGGSLKGVEVLDFGSGSGILSIGAALMGARVDACEIDPLANDNAFENARLNAIEGHIRISERLEDCVGPYGIVIANILKPVLLQFVGELMKRRAPGASLILSGLVEADVASVVAAYGPWFEGREPEVASLGEWRGIFWG